MSGQVATADGWRPDVYSSQLPPVAGDGATVEGPLLDTVVAGDPDACRRVADELRRSGARLDDLVAALIGAVRVPREVFDGRAGEAYRLRSRSLAGRAAAARDHTRRLADGLDRLADGLDSAAAGMRRARSLAGTTLTVTADGVAEPVAGAPPEQWRTWRTVREIAADARAVERAAHERWRWALADEPPADRPARRPAVPSPSAGGPAEEVPEPVTGAPAAAAGATTTAGPTAGAATGSGGLPGSRPPSSPGGAALVLLPVAGDDQAGVLWPAAATDPAPVPTGRCPELPDLLGLGEVSDAR